MPAQLIPDLVGLLLNAGSDAGHDVRGRRTQRSHGREGGFENAGERPFPARVGGSDGPARRIGEQHRDTIGRQHTDGEPGRGRHQSVGTGALASGQSFAERDDLGTVNLRERIHSVQRVRRKAEGVHHPAAILRHVNRVVAGRRPTVQRGINAPGDTALAGKETVANSALPGEELTGQAFHGPHDDTAAIAVPHGTGRAFLA